MSWLSGVGSWLSGKAWWLVALLLVIVATLLTVLTLARSRLKWLETAVVAARDRAKLANARAQAHRTASERYRETAAWAKRELAIILADDEKRRLEVRAMRRAVDKATTADEVLDLWAREYGSPQ